MLGFMVRNPFGELPYFGQNHKPRESIKTWALALEKRHK
jgi:hypothetical protein